MRERTQGGYIIKCQRCGRPFFSRHANSRYCDLQSPYPEDKGKTCKELQRVESKRNERARGKKLRESIESGTYVMTSMYGIISRGEYVAKFTKYIMDKYHLKSYAAYQKWAAENVEALGNEYDEFQNITGLKRMDINEE